MKKNGILNLELSSAVARMGHGDIILIGDLGCAFPSHDRTVCVDLAVTKDLPLVRDVIKVILEELVVEAYIVPQEMKDVSPGAYGALRKILSEYGKGERNIEEKILPHTEMKDLWLHGPLNGQEVKVFVRTGECTPYGYLMLIAGVSF